MCGFSAAIPRQFRAQRNHNPKREAKTMVVNMLSDATEEQINHVVDRIKECGYQAHLIRGVERTVIAAVGSDESRRGELEALRAAAGVEELVRIAHPYKLA